MEPTKLYKVLGPNHTSTNGGTTTWEPGVWMPAIKGDLVLCENGYHLCRFANLLNWINEEIWEAEYQGEIIEGDDKVVVREARIIRHIDTWNEVTARLFAAECAEHVLPIFEKDHPKDDRPRKAIEAACLFAFGEIDAASRAAAGAASWAASRAAAEAASMAASWAAAEAASWAAAEAASRAAAEAASMAASWAAAEAASRAASRAAAEAASWAAAEAASRAAERTWQVECLESYLQESR